MAKGAQAKLAILLLLLTVPAPTAAEEVCVKYHKCVSLSQFKCDDITRSSFIWRVCYAEPKRYMLIQLGRQKTYYHYCNVGPEVVAGFEGAPSMGRYYNANIRGTAQQHGPFDCRDHAVPEM
jgi:hypothetical protein